jgi:NADH:ubiquinone oxidoreductase subunit H
MDSIKFLDPTTQFVLFSVLKVILVFSIGMGGVAYSVLVERKVSAWTE